MSTVQERINFLEQTPEGQTILASFTCCLEWLFASQSAAAQSWRAKVGINNNPVAASATNPATIAAPAAAPTGAATHARPDHDKYLAQGIANDIQTRTRERDNRACPRGVAVAIAWKIVRGEIPDIDHAMEHITPPRSAGPETTGAPAPAAGGTAGTGDENPLEGV